MKKLLFLFFILIGTIANAQYSATGANGILVQSEQYITNSPTSTVGNRVNMLILKDSTRWENRWRGIYFTKYTATRNDGTPSGILWTASDGAFKHSPMSEVRLDWTQILNKPGLFSGDYNDLINKPTLFSGNYSDLIGKPSLFSGNYDDLINKPPLFSGNYNDLTNKPAIPSNTNQLTNGANFITQAGARNSISVTTLGSGAASYEPSTGVINIPTNTIPSWSFNNSASKTINGAGVQLSTTRDALVSYSIQHNIALTLLLATGSSQAFLEISPNNSTWTTISQTGYGDGVAVAIVLNKTTTGNLQGIVPAGWYVRIRSVVSGAGSTTFLNGQEVLK